MRFLNGGARVKVTIMFRGREMAHTELGRKILDRLVDDLDDIATVDSQPKQDGRNMIMVIAPTKKRSSRRPRRRRSSRPTKDRHDAEAEDPQRHRASGSG